MKRIVSILLIAMAVFMFTACQKTPESPIVVGKDHERMIEQAQEVQDRKIQGLALRERYGIPERFVVDVSESDGKLIITSDVEIVLPDADAVPMARVTADSFDQEMVYKLFERLCGDTKMYIVPETISREQYQETILLYQQRLAQTTDEQTRQFYEDMIEDLIESSRNAPESVPVEASDGTLQAKEAHDENTTAATGTRTFLNAVSDLNAEDAMLFEIVNDVEYENTDIQSYKDEYGNEHVIAPVSGSRIGFERNKGDTPNINGTHTFIADVTELSINGGHAEGAPLAKTPSEARQEAEQFLAQMGIEDMTIDCIELISNQDSSAASIPPQELAFHGEERAKEERFGYSVRLLRRLEGVLVESTYGSSSSKIGDAPYGREWSYEDAHILIDDQGIAGFDWTAPLTVQEILVENTSLLSFSDVQSIFEKMLTVKYEPDVNEENVERMRIRADRAELCLWRITDKNSFTDGLLVPVWCFYCTKEISYKDRTEPFLEETVSSKEEAEIIINAIDGSVIDVDAGY